LPISASLPSSVMIFTRGRGHRRHASSDSSAGSPRAPPRQGAGAHRAAHMGAPAIPTAMQSPTMHRSRVLSSTISGCTCHSEVHPISAKCNNRSDRK
jgi:hypothetical protein